MLPRVASPGRPGGEVALVLLDIDRFKELNDAHGHQAGDDVLRRLGEILVGNSRFRHGCALRRG